MKCWRDRSVCQTRMCVRVGSWRLMQRALTVVNYSGTKVFSMIPLRILGGLSVVSVLTITRLAAADAQQCVTHNNDGVDLRAKHKLLGAREAYRECVADPGCPGVVRAECETALV